MITRHNPSNLFASEKSGFSQISIKETKDLKIISMSGQVAWNENREVVGKDDLYLQIVTSFKNIEKALAVGGAKLSDIASFRIYIVESQIKNSEAVTKALLEVFGDDLPCATWIGVPALASGDFLVEIEPDPIFISKN